MSFLIADMSTLAFFPALFLIVEDNEVSLPETTSALFFSPVYFYKATFAAIVTDAFKSKVHNLNPLIKSKLITDHFSNEWC